MRHIGKYFIMSILGISIQLEILKKMKRRKIEIFYYLLSVHSLT